MVTVGIDPHERSHTAAAIDDDEELLDQVRLAAGAGTVAALLEWAQRWPERTWAVQGMTGPGRLLAQRLVAAGEAVVDVSPELAARVRFFSVGQARKTDLDDATSVARAAGAPDASSRWPTASATRRACCVTASAGWRCSSVASRS